MRNRSRAALVNLLIVIVAIVAALGATEVGMRLFMPRKHFAVTVNTWDPVTGTRQIPGATGYVKTGEYEIDLIINSKGLRDREFTYGKPDGTKRILCLGGSFTCGYGVQFDETYAKVLERLLNREADRNHTWEVLNAGTGSTGTSHQLAFFVTEGYKYNPDFVLLCFSQDTDYWDNIISGLYTLDNGELVKHDAPLTSQRMIQRVTGWIPGYNTVFRRSHLLNFIKGRVARLHYRTLAERIVPPDSTTTVAEVEEKEEELTRALILALREACDSTGSRLVMTGIPDGTRGWTYHDETIELVAFADSHDIPFVSLSETLAGASARGVALTFERDRHWNSDGHELAGRRLSRFFARID